MTVDGTFDASAVDRVLQGWRQGDCVLGAQWFVHRTDSLLPLSPAAKQLAANAGDSDLAEEEVPGLTVLTQTCDIVRKCSVRPYVEVSPLVEVEANLLPQVQHDRIPRFAAIPALAGRRLVADLDRVMTVEKAIVARWERTPGWNRDAESRAFSRALARKRSRFAFPNDFDALVKPLRERLTEKHGRKSPEGRALQSLREIRVRAAPSWNDSSVYVTFWFVRSEDGDSFEGRPWADWYDAWMKLVPSSGRFDVDGEVTTLDRLTAEEFVESDLLDLDHLTAVDEE